MAARGIGRDSALNAALDGKWNHTRNEAISHRKVIAEVAAVVRGA
jgi:hypothetical protein